MNFILFFYLFDIYSSFKHAYKFFFKFCTIKSFRHYKESHILIPQFGTATVTSKKLSRCLGRQPEILKAFPLFETGMES